MQSKTLRDLLHEELRDLYSAEKQLVKALPKLAKTAASPELRAGFEKHLHQTQGHVRRLEEAFELLGVPSRAKKCAAMEGLIEEGKEMIEEDLPAAVKDAGLIAAAQKVEHYEIASYGCVRTWAQRLGLKDVANLLAQTLEEEKATDATLTELAERQVNEKTEEAPAPVVTKNGTSGKKATVKK